MRTPSGGATARTRPGSTARHMWHDALTLVRDSFSPLGHCTHYRGSRIPATSCPRSWQRAEWSKRRPSQRPSRRDARRFSASARGLLSCSLRAIPSGGRPQARSLPAHGQPLPRPVVRVGLPDPPPRCARRALPACGRRRASAPGGRPVHPVASVSRSGRSARSAGCRRGCGARRRGRPRRGPRRCRCAGSGPS
jgi:hypothetical protein